MENKELSHAEVWDDSALINTWDTAMQEYKKYHSIQGSASNKVIEAARTEITSKKDVEKNMDVEMGNEETSGDHDERDGNAKSISSLEEGELEAEPQLEELSKGRGTRAEEVTLTGTTSENRENNSRVQHAGEGVSSQDSESTKPPGLPPFPASVLGGENEALRNLMISWYFAGYYTGLYEGQQQAQNARK